MSQYANLKAAIAANVYENHNNQVTANMVKAAMNAMTDSLGAGYQYLGIATPNTAPGTPDQKVFYIAAQPGDYPNFGTGITVAEGEVAVLKWDTAWHKEVTGAATAAQVTELGQEVEGLESQLKGEYNTTIKPLESIECNIPKGAITANITNNEDLDAYFTLVFSDSNNNAIYTITTDYIIGGATKTYAFDADEDIAKISLTYDNNMIPLDLAVISSGFVAGQLSNINEEISTIQEDITDIKDQIEINADSAESLVLVANNAAINEDGDIIEDADEVNTLWKIKVTPFCNYLLDNVRAIVRASGTYFKYAWYSSFEVINSGTFISGSSETAPFDEYITDTVTPPNGALALVVSIYVNVGSVKKAQNTTNSMEQVFFKRNIIEDAFLRSLRNIYNGTPRLLGTAYSLKDYGITPTVTGNSPYENKMNLSGIGWCYFGAFNPDVDELIHISFNVSELITTGNDISIYVVKGAVGAYSDSMRLLGKIPDKGNYDIILDPTYYRVHEGFTDTFYLWIYKTDVAIGRCVINNMKIFSNVNEIPLVNIDGANGAELMQSIDNSIGQIQNIVDSEEYLISPNGNKHILAVNNDGTLKTIPVIPNKAAFFGNSLMFGNYYFGMDATNINNDFYAKINAYIASVNPSYSPEKFSSVPFETISSLADIDSVVQSTINNLTGDEDLIVIQAGDNTSDTQATSILPTSSLALLSAIKTKCPNARICWPAIWYATSDKMNAIRNACQRYGALLIPISDLNVSENQSYVGAIIDYGAGNSQTNTLSNVSSVVENSATNITITFTYQGVEYTKTIDIISYELDGTTLTYTGRYLISTVGAGHPGNRGMKAIANKLLYAMGISDDENAYPLD